jgi:hypothetical protein
VFVRGGLPPNSKHRGQITPAKRGKKTIKIQAGAADWLDKSPEERHRAMTWMQRLKRVFNIDIDIDIETCERCDGKVKVIASIEDPAVIAHIRCAGLAKTRKTEGGSAGGPSTARTSTATRTTSGWYVRPFAVSSF